MAKNELTKEPSSWVGWVYFAGIMMFILGLFDIIAGLVALFKQDYYLVLPNTIVNVNFDAWGWVHLLLGTLILLAGLAVLAGKMWGRVVGVLVASLAALSHMIFIAAYPLWSIIVITLCVVVIYALCVHGGEARVE